MALIFCDPLKGASDTNCGPLQQLHEVKPLGQQLTCNIDLTVLGNRLYQDLPHSFLKVSGPNL
jgi:hypothetical protein